MKCTKSKQSNVNLRKFSMNRLKTIIKSWRRHKKYLETTKTGNNNKGKAIDFCSLKG